MKNIAQIINDFSSMHQYAPLKKNLQCQHFIQTLRNDIKQNLLSKTSKIYIFNDNIIIVAKNNAALQELVLQSNKDILENSLKLYQKLSQDETLKTIKNIKYMVEKNPKKMNFNCFENEKFTEHSNGDFKNILKNENAKITLEEIKKIIKKNIK